MAEAAFSPGSIISNRGRLWRVDERAEEVLTATAIDGGELSYILDTFPIVKRKDEEAHGEYRTKRLVLEQYDALVGEEMLERSGLSERRCRNNSFARSPRSS